MPLSTVEGSAWPILLTGAMLIVNGFFVAAEFALVRIRRTQIEEMVEGGSARARLVDRQLGKIDWYLSACQVGITGASLALGWIGEPAVAALISPLFGWLINISETLFHVLSFAVAFAIITFLHIVLAEQAPKYYAIQKPVSVALLNAYPLQLFYQILWPFTWLVNHSANRLLSLLGVKQTAEHAVHSGDELKLLVERSADSGELQESERLIVGNALNFADTLVRQVMVPRTEMIAMPDDLDRAAIVTLARTHPYSRFPVYHVELDDMVGVLHLRDLVLRPDVGPTARELMRKPFVIPETTHLDKALTDMRRQRVSLAIIVDEFGGTAGLATIEDILEELVGEVKDEFEREEAPRIRREGAVWIIDGLTALDEVHEALDLHLPEDLPYDTVGGLVFGVLGRLAVVGDRVDVDGWRFEVIALDGRRVAQVRAERTQFPEGAPSAK